EKDAFVIGHIGRFCAQKNHKFLLDAFRLVAQKNPEARLLLVGEGPLFEETIALSKELGIEEKVLFLGSVKNPEDYYSAMDLFVLPSLYEGLPVVAVEAQTNGLQCLFSTEVTKEAKLLESTDYLALSDGAEVWAKKMENPSVLDRKEGLRVMSTTIYSIHSEAKKLLAKYKEGSRK
ncbi:MAG: glycosyltransferase, partial [Spirochaetales bacterium]|nr:glycosyltransferase [Candidatus Physcosoma equi]